MNALKSKKNLGAVLGEYGAFIALALLVIVLSIIEPSFRAPSNLMNLLRQASFNGLIAFGMTLVILSDGIDLSVGSIIAMSGCFAAGAVVWGGMPEIVGLTLGVLSGLMFGLF